MKYKNVIFFYPSFEKGGVEKILVNLVRFFLIKNLNVTLISSKLNQKISHLNFNHIVLKKSQGRFSSAYNGACSLKKVLKRHKKLGIISNTVVFSLQSNSAAIIISKYYSTKIIIRNSEYILGGLISKDENFFKSFFILIQKIIIYTFSNYIISNSKGSAEILKKFILNKNIEYIYNPYLKEINKVKPISNKRNVILFVGRFVKQKGIIYLLKSYKLLLKQNYKYKLILIGDGPEKKKIKTFIKKNKFSNQIKIIDWRNNLSHYYFKSKIFVLPSIYEGLGNVVIEALNHFLPVVISDCKSGPKEIIKNGAYGKIFKNKDVKDLCKSIKFVNDNYQDFVKKTIKGNSSLNRFLITKQCSKYYNVLKKI